MRHATRDTRHATLSMVTNLFYTDRVLNLGHRGASQAAPENTLPAFRLAAEMGADGVELDVQLSQDGQVVIIHDFAVDKTTDGQGLVKDKTLAELKKLDAGRHFGDQFAGTPIPTLAELFMAIGPVLLYNIELKTKSFVNDGLEAEVIRLIEDFNLSDHVVLSSFNPVSLRRAYNINKNIKRGLLWSPQLPFYLRYDWAKYIARPDMAHPHWPAATPALISRLHRQDKLVNVWTCNQPDDMRRLVSIGVDTIITDRPDLLKQVLDEAA